MSRRRAAVPSPSASHPAGSGTSMREHWQGGYEDTRRTLKRQEWMAMPAARRGVVVHDVHRQED